MKHLINRLICLGRGHKWEQIYSYRRQYILKATHECTRCGEVKEEWEYNDVSFDYTLVKKPFVEWLNDYGKQGLELVDVYSFGLNVKQCIFKRKIQ